MITIRSLRAGGGTTMWVPWLQHGPAKRPALPALPARLLSSFMRGGGAEEFERFGGKFASPRPSPADDAAVKPVLSKRAREAASLVAKKSRFAKRRAASKTRKEQKVKEREAARQVGQQASTHMAPVKHKRSEAGRATVAAKRGGKGGRGGESSGSVGTSLQDNETASASRVPRLESFFHENVVCATK